MWQIPVDPLDHSNSSLSKSANLGQKLTKFWPKSGKNGGQSPNPVALKVDHLFRSVLVGEHDVAADVDCLRDGGGCLPPVQNVEVDVDDVTIHDGWNAVSYVNDIALVRLKTAVKLLLVS